MTFSLVIFVDFMVLILAAFLLWYFPWVLFIVYPKKRQMAFNSTLNFDKIVPLIKGSKFLYLSLYGLTLVWTLILDGVAIGFSCDFGKAAIDLEEINFVGCLITILLIFILFHLGFVLILLKLGKKLKSEKSKNDAIQDFIYFKENWTENQPIRKFKIQTVIKISGINADLSPQQEEESSEVINLLSPLEEFVLFLKFPWQKELPQSRASWLIGNPRALPLLEKFYRRKIKKLVNKNLTDEQYFWKLSRIFIAYLNKCANFIIITKLTKYEPFLSIDDHGISGVGELKEAFINNFFSFEQEFQSLKNNL